MLPSSKPYLNLNEDLIERAKAGQTWPRSTAFVTPAVEAARESLASTRALAVKLRDEFMVLAATHKATFDNAYEECLQADACGVHPGEAWNVIARARQIMDGGIVSFQGIIIDIDTLNAYRVSQSYHLHIPGRLQMAKSNFHGLTDLVAKLPFHLREMRERVAASTRTPRVAPTAINVPEAPQVRVVTGFDPRER